MAQVVFRRGGTIREHYKGKGMCENHEVKESLVFGTFQEFQVVHCHCKVE